MKSLLRETLHVGKRSFMVDSGIVLQWHGIRAARDTDIVVFGALSHELIPAISVDQVNIHFFRSKMWTVWTTVGFDFTSIATTCA